VRYTCIQQTNTIYSESHRFLFPFGFFFSTFCCILVNLLLGPEYELGEELVLGRFFMFKCCSTSAVTWPCSASMERNVQIN
jgi:hypothetical protein